MRSNLFEKPYDFMTRKTWKSVRWTVFGYALTYRARQYPGTSSAIARIGSKISFDTNIIICNILCRRKTPSGCSAPLIIKIHL